MSLTREIAEHLRENSDDDTSLECEVQLIVEFLKARGWTPPTRWTLKANRDGHTDLLDNDVIVATYYAPRDEVEDFALFLNVTQP